jgi:hypothetical protein
MTSLKMVGRQWKAGWKSCWTPMASLLLGKLRLDCPRTMPEGHW